MDLLILVAIVVAIFVGVLWLCSYLGAPDPLRKVIVVVTAVVLIIYFLRATGFTIPNVLH